MLDTLLFDLTNTLGQENLLLTFCGPFSQGIIEELGTALRGYLSTTKNLSQLRSSVFSIFIEQTQNIRNYFRTRAIDELSDSRHGYGIVVIGNDKDKFFVSSGNLVYKADLEPLIKRIEHIKSLSKEDVQALYKQTLRNKQVSESGGAGLGFIEMARRASEPLEFSTTVIDDRSSFFTLRVVI